MKLYDFDSEHDDKDFSAGSSDEYDPSQAKETVQRKSLRGIMAYQAMVQQRGGLFDNKTPISMRGRGIPIARRSGRGLSRGRGRARGWRIETIRAHRQSLDEMIVEDQLNPSSKSREKSPKKMPPTLTKGSLF